MADVYRRHGWTQNEGASERRDASHANGPTFAREGRGLRWQGEPAVCPP
jgi:hypothetical protein